MKQQNQGKKTLKQQQLAVSPRTLELIEITLNQPKHVANYNGIEFVINPGVFPFDSISYSSISMADYLPSKKCDRVLDMGTGCGIQAVTAYFKGAKSVLAVDIDPKAVQNARENVRRLGLDGKISVLKSDLFDSVPLEQFDMILAQLPFSNIDYDVGVSHLFFDLDYKLHERFLSQATKYLRQNGKIILAGGDLGDEKRLYALIEKYGYSIEDEATFVFNNIKWKIYAITPCFEGGLNKMNQENIYENRVVVEKYSLSRSIPDQILQQYCNKIIEYTHPKSICDVGFGKGSTLIPFAKDKTIKVLGIDSSEEMSKFVLSELKSRKLQADIITCDASNLSDIQKNIDLIHIKAVTHIPKNPFTFLAKISKSIKTGGYLVIGKEYSQPEDNLENIGKYGLANKEDSILKAFYQEYFRIRSESGKPFVMPAMPAGDYDNAVNYLENAGFKIEKEISTSSWSKGLTLSELIEAMKKGTFTVFSKNCTPLDKEKYASAMEEFCVKNKFDLNLDRFYQAELRAVILRKDVELKEAKSKC